MFEHSDPKVYRGAVKGVGFFGYDAFLPIIELYGRTANQTAKRCCPKAFVQLFKNFPNQPFPEEVMHLLRHSIEDSDMVVVQGGLMCLGQLGKQAVGGEEAVVLLIHALKHENIALVYSATQALADINHPLVSSALKSLIDSSSDNFSCNLMTLLSRLPIFPLYYYGKTKFTPIHCSDLTDIIHFVISKKVNSNVIECIGPEVLTFKEILIILLNTINKKRLLIPFPLPLAMMTAKVFQLLPNPLLTVDQLKLLNYDNVVSGKYKTNFDIGVPAKKVFSNEIEKYSYMWREGGEYSKKKI